MALLTDFYHVFLGYCPTAMYCICGPLTSSTSFLLLFCLKPLFLSPDGEAEVKENPKNVLHFSLTAYFKEYFLFHIFIVLLYYFILLFYY